MANHPHFLVIDGYDRSGREALAAGGATPAGELYSQTLKKCHSSCDVDIIYPADPGVSLPQGTALESYDGIAWTGSSLTVYADDPRVQPQIELAKAAFETKVPSFGSCWAAQIAVVAAGGRCAANPRGREMGIARKIALTPEGRAHPLYAGKPDVFDAFISHEDEVTHLPPGAMLLASNAFTNVQAVAVTHNGGTCWGLQYHPEYDLHELARLTYCRIEKLVKLGFFADRDSALDYIDKLEILHQDPSRQDLAWLLGIDADVMNED
ncbi:MAG: type 1 glutamine amidotransferase, partial [Acidiferrobacterales bacterium]